MNKAKTLFLFVLLPVFAIESVAQSFDSEKDYWRADTNRDRIIDISDIVSVINYIAEGKKYVEPTQPMISYWRARGKYEWYPDVNQDDVVDISDIVGIINIMATGKGSKTIDCAVEEGYCPDSQHPHAINLGIGAPVACCNLGAQYPDEHGGYYTWGETDEDMNFDRQYSEYNYPYFLYDEYKNGRPSSECWVIKDEYINLTAYDGPQKHWGGLWTLPTPELAQTIVERCTVEYTQLYGKNGMKVTGPNGKSIFLPASGMSRGAVMDALKGGYFWTSSQLGGWLTPTSRYWPTSLMFDPEASEIKLASDRYHNFYPYEAWTAISIRPSYLDLTHFSSCPDNKHPHSIDMGLPSGLHWACCNVGALSPEQAGEYYRWGSTEPAMDLNAYYGQFPKDMDDIASTEYDVAHVKWQNGWKIPTYDEMNELINECTFISGYFNGEKCGMFTGPNGNRIIMNFGGNMFYDVSSYGSFGNYFSSTKKADLNIYKMWFTEKRAGMSYEFGDYGTPVRPVRYFY